MWQTLFRTQWWGRHCPCPHISHCLVAGTAKYPRSSTRCHHVFFSPIQSLVHFEATTRLFFGVRQLFLLQLCTENSKLLQSSSTHPAFVSITVTKIPSAGWYINNRHLFFMVPEARSPRSRHQQIPRLVRACFLVYRRLSSPCVLTWWKEREALWGRFYKGTHPIYASSALMPSSLPQSPTDFSMPSPWGAGFDPIVLGGHERSVRTALVATRNSVLPDSTLQEGN